ncbi:hypothetical protein EII20_07395 [Comamonadaceae bacterium OH2545_COT-014]|nr:hypothetical protein EII20_07395 [Comamonadaceae bacterium OH2545_COT-014]
MSAKTFSREWLQSPAQGNLKKLQRMRQPLALGAAAPPPRNHVALALAARSASNAAGKHIRQTGAQRRADKMALQKLLRQTGDE